MISGLILLIPKLVRKYLGKNGFSREMLMVIIFGGIFWIIIACNNEILCSILNIRSDGDASAFEEYARSSIMKILQSGNYSLTIRNLIHPGQMFYSGYQGIIYYFTGGTVVSIIAINVFMAFWGGLILTRLLYAFSIAGIKSFILPFFIIFTPSVVFWSGMNLKEGLMYWAVCQIVNFVIPSRSPKQSRYNFLAFYIGAIIGSLLRPQIIIIWITAVLLVKMLQPRYWKYIIIFIILCQPILINVGRRSEGFSVEKSFRTLQGQMGSLISRDRKSTFNYGESGHIPVVSGAISVLFRPFIWRIGNLRSFLSAIEIWTISISIFFFWMRMNKMEWKSILQNQSIMVAILVCIPFFVYYTYLPNEGLIARQRIQLFPALMILLAAPILQRKSLVLKTALRKKF